MAFNRYALSLLILSVIMLALPSVANAQIGAPVFCVKTGAPLGAPGTTTPINQTCADSGAYVAIKATANSGATFGTWTLPENCTFYTGYTNVANTRITCNAGQYPYPDYTAYASFLTVTSTSTTTVPSSQFCVTANVYTGGGGQVYPTSNTCAYAGQPVSIIATPNSGFAFSTWFLPSGCVYASGYGNTASTQVTCSAGNYTVSGGFTQSTTSSTTTVSSAQFCVNTTAQGGGGTTYPVYYSCYYSGQAAYIYATPQYGYGFGAWYLPGGCTFAQGYGNTATTYVICAAGQYSSIKYTISATFTLKTTTVAPEFCVNATLYSAGTGGSVTPANGCAFSGQSVVISASAPVGYSFSSWYLPSGCTYANGYGNSATTQIVCTPGSYPFPSYQVAARFSSTYAAPASATVTLYRGWNLFSVPLVNASVSSSTCSSSNLLSPIWQFTNGAYSKAASIQGGYGYWLDASTQCSITFTGAPLTISRLPAITLGWNLIGALNYSTSFTNILGGCNVTSGPLGFDVSTNSYYNATQLASGSGYFVKVSGSCTLGSSNLPPSPP